ncbi:hypothetical protein OC835_007342, partial [Tilletia horrida]
TSLAAMAPKKDTGKTRDVEDVGDDSTLSSVSAASASSRDEGPDSVRTLLNKLLEGQQESRSQLSSVRDRLDALELRSGRTTPTQTNPVTLSAANMAPSVSASSVASAPPDLGGTTGTSVGPPIADSITGHMKSPPSLRYEDRNTLEAVLAKYGMSVSDVFPSKPSFTTHPPPVATQASTSLATTQGPIMPRADGATVTAPITPAPPSYPRQLTCKPETLTSFDGDPTQLEAFASRVEDIARQSDDPAWDAAVRLAIPQALKGVAAKWHAGLKKEDVRKMRTVEDVTEALRRAFPMNRALLRKLARDRHWEPKKESALAYLFDKIQLFRQAFGDAYPDASIAQDAADGLEPSMLAYIRLPRNHPTLHALQDAIGEWEPTWRAVHNVSIDPEQKQATKEDGPALTSNQVTLPGKPPRPPRAEQRPTPDRSASSALATSAPQPSASVASLAASYDPTRVVPASGSQPRLYRRPDSTRVMRLQRNCAKCGQAHFDFEHEHLVASGQVHTIGYDDGFDEVDEVDLGLPPFTQSF